MLSSNEKTSFPTGTRPSISLRARRDLEAEDVEIIEERGPTMLVGGHALVTGQIARTTSFEKGSPTQVAWIDGKWQPDPWIHDDQAVIMNVKDKGLVVLTGCGHAGVVNTLKHARDLTGVDHIHAVIGGFHLTGPIFEPIIVPTVQALKGIQSRASSCPSTAPAGGRCI